MLKNKRGQGLPINTIIIAILVIVVLVVVIVFFLGGFAGISNKIKVIFFGVTAGTDYTLAVQNCQSWCDQAKMLPVATRKTTAYCNTYQAVDIDSNGEADKVSGTDTYIRFFCHADTIKYDANKQGEGNDQLNVACVEGGKSICK